MRNPTDANTFTNLLNDIKTDVLEFDKEVTWLDCKLTHNFITSGSINIISGNSGVGKTYFITALAIQLLKLGVLEQVIHINFDGNTDIFGSRNQSDDIKFFYHQNKWFHIRAEDMSSKKMNIAKFVEEQIESKMDFSKTLFIYDSLVNFVPKLNDTDTVSIFMGHYEKVLT